MSNSMRFVTDLSKGVLGQSDSAELWAEIISHIPDEVLLTPGVRILSVACGHCTEALLIAKRMLALGISKEAVRESIWLIDKYAVFTNFAKDKYGFKNVVQQDFLAWEPGMKFDVVVGNPPYQATTNTEKGNTQGDLWYAFLRQSIELVHDHGYVAFITPRSWCGIGGLGTKRFKFNTFKSNAPIWVNFDTSKFFNVGITTCAYVLQKLRSGPTVIENIPGITELDFSDYRVLPFHISKESISVLNKVLKVNNGGAYSFVEGNGKNTGMPKVAAIRARFIAADKIFVDDTGNTEHSYKCSMVLQEDQVDGAKTLFSSALARFIFTILGGPDGQSQTGILKNLPVVDLTRTWTDADLYQHFGLTEEEIAYVEATVK